MSEIDQERAGYVAPTWDIEELEAGVGSCSVTELTPDNDGLDRLARLLLEAKKEEEDESVGPGSPVI